MSLSLELEQVVALQDDRNLGQYLCREIFAADTTLQFEKRQNAAVSPRQNFAVENGAVRQLASRPLDLGKAVGHQVLAA